MSDGALSQDEIDALLAGVDSAGFSGSGGGAGGSEDDRRAIQNFLSGTTGGMAGNLSTQTGTQVSVKGPDVNWETRDSLLSALPDTVTAVKSDYTSGFPGEHTFLMGEDTAKAVAALMNKEENIELDEMAMSMIGEMVSQIVGSQITDLTNKTGNKSIVSSPPEAANVPKATAALPGGNFLAATYNIDLGDGVSHRLWEVFGGAAAGGIAQALTGGGPPKAASGMGASPGGMGSMGASLGGGMGGMGGASTGGMGGGMPSNVQSVQFPNLMSPPPTAQEQANIGLIMDVFMEMTVELGRTRKLIKEILSMGEGTIIELDKLAGEPVDILVNHKLIAKGEVVVIDENFGVRVTEIVSPNERLSDMN
ncbi:MAG: flagellar motor switch protein FliN [Treponema sp.]|jgi:flagellar motor switch protein FliN/FliY|nr:flagellar motor switch protein FliN [Treponema sp.]